MNKKGIGYAIELVIAVLIIFTFIIGSMQLQAGKTYTDYRISTTANDINYMTQETGLMDSIAVRGQTGTLQTFIQSITDRQLKLSGSIRGMPFQDQIKIGFHTNEEISSNTFDAVDSSDKCEGNLNEIQVYHEGGDILINQDNTYQDQYNATLYLANTSETSEYEYDALFVDKGRNCDFTDGGPHYINDIFMWGTAKSPGPIHFYEFKEGIDSGGNQPLFYNATQVRRFQESFNKEVNNLDVQTEINLFTNSDPYNHYDLKIFREGFGYTAADFEDSLSNSSALFLHNVSATSDSVLDILDNDDYDGVSGNSGVQSVTFPDYWAARNLRDYYMAMGNQGYVRYPSGGDVEAYQDDSRALAKNSAGDLTIVNHWTDSERNDLKIDRIARTGYLEYPKYTEKQIDFLVALSYWLTEEEEQFNHEIHSRNLIPTSSTGVAGSEKEVPYQLNLRWSR